MKLRLALAVCLMGSAAVCRADEERAIDVATASLAAAGTSPNPLDPTLNGLAGCCEPFNCCQDVWDGYCDEQRSCHRCGHLASGPLCWLSCRKYRDRHSRHDCCPSQCCTPGHQQGGVVEVVVSETVMPAAPTRCCKPGSSQAGRGRKATQANHRVSHSKIKTRQ